MNTLFCSIILLLDVGLSRRGLDPENTGLVRTLVPGGELLAVAFSPDGSRLAAGVAGGVRVYDTATWKRFPTCSGVNHPLTLAFSRDGKRVAAGGAEEAVAVWEADTGRLLQTAPHPGHVIAGLSFSRNGSTLTIVSHDGSVRTWAYQTSGEPKDLGRISTPGRISFSAGGERAAAPCPDGKVRIWRTDSWIEENSLAGADQGIALTFSRSGGRLAAAMHGTGIRMWESGKDGFGSPIVSFDEPVAAIRMTPDDRFLLGACGKDVCVWEVRTGRAAARLRHHTYPILGLAMHPDGRVFATIGQDHHLKIWGPVRGGMAGIRRKGFCGIQTGDGAPRGTPIVHVYPGSPAESFGLKVGDLLLKVDGVPVAGSGDMIDQISGHYEGDEVEFDIERDGKGRTVRVKLADRPASFDP